MLVYIIMLCLNFIISDGATNPIEVDALIGMKQSLIDPDNVLASWKAGSDPCEDEWFAISCNFGSISSLAFVNLTTLSGTISSHIGNLTHLSVLMVYNTPIGGSFPGNFPSLTNLSKLTVCYTEMEGSFPAMCRSELLTHVKVVSNSFSGSISEFLACASQLQYINFAGNRFLGALPNDSWASGALNTLVLSGNAFSGPIPSAPFRQAGGLQSLYLPGNFFTGPLPPSLASVPTLAVLDVSGNRLQGTLPAFGAGLQAHSLTLNLSRNSFTGPIPASLATFSQSQVLHLDVSYNNLSGPLPQGLALNSSQIRLAHNPLLCGGPSLPLCGPAASGGALPPPPGPLPTFVEPGLSLGVKLGAALGALLCVALLASCLLGTFRNRGRAAGEAGKKATDEVLGTTPGELVRFSYGQLHKLTRGFEYRALIGRGGCGQVYRVTLGEGQRSLAVKVLSPQSRPGGSKGFERELAAMAVAHHRNLVSLVGFCEDQGTQMIVSEFVPHGNLSSHVHGPQAVLPWQARSLIVSGVARGLCYLHWSLSPPMVHGDIKPSNVLLGEGWVPKIGDFGTASLLHGPHSVLSTQVVGTTGYLAPERVSSRVPNPAWDVFSFGVLVLEVVSGDPPAGRDVSGDLLPRARAAAAGDLLGGFVDGKLLGDFDEAEAMTMVLVALRCVDLNPGGRPSMDLVVKVLEGDSGVEKLPGI